MKRREGDVNFIAAPFLRRLRGLMVSTPGSHTSDREFKYRWNLFFLFFRHLIKKKISCCNTNSIKNIVQPFLCACVSVSTPTSWKIASASPLKWEYWAKRIFVFCFCFFANDIAIKTKEWAHNVPESLYP